MDPDPEQNRNSKVEQPESLSFPKVAAFLLPPLKMPTAYFEKIKDELQCEMVLPVQVGPNETAWNWLKRTLRQIDSSIEAYLFVSSEHQNLSPDLLQKLVDEWQKHSWASISVASFGGHRGGPVLVSSLLKREILSMRQADLSFHRLTVKYPQQTLEVHFDEPFDTLDRVDQFQEFLEG